MIAAVEAATAAANAATAAANAATAALANNNNNTAVPPMPTPPPTAPSPAILSPAELEAQRRQALQLAEEKEKQRVLQDMQMLRDTAAAAAKFARDPAQHATVARMLRPSTIGVALYDSALVVEDRRALWCWLEREYVPSMVNLARAARVADGANYALDAFIHGSGWRRDSQDLMIQKTEDAVTRATRAGLQKQPDAAAVAQFLVEITFQCAGSMREADFGDQLLTLVPPAAAIEVLRRIPGLRCPLLCNFAVTHDLADLLRALLDCGHTVDQSYWRRLHSGPIFRRPLVKVREVLSQRGLLESLGGGGGTAAVMMSPPQPMPQVPPVIHAPVLSSPAIKHQPVPVLQPAPEVPTVIKQQPAPVLQPAPEVPTVLKHQPAPVIPAAAAAKEGECEDEEDDLLRKLLRDVLGGADTAVAAEDHLSKLISMLDLARGVLRR
jgi:hypothetical protein